MPIHRLATRPAHPALVLAAAAVTAIFVAASPAAASFGLYFDTAIGDVMPEAPYAGGVKYKTTRLSAGITTDSAVAKDKLFNYRMNLGYENVRERLDGFGTFGIYHGASFENIFGFGVYRSKLMRVWLGPSLRIASGVLDKGSVLGAALPAGRAIRFTGAGGLATGVNFHTGNLGSAALTIGYQFGYNGTFLTGGGAAVPSALNGTEHRINFGFAYYFRGEGDRFE